MMKEGVVYECVDERKGVKYPLDGLVMINPVPGGQEVLGYATKGEIFQFEDDDQFEDSEAVTTFYMPEGRLYFVELTLPDFERFEGQSQFDTPKFKTTAELQAWFRERIEPY